MKTTWFDFQDFYDTITISIGHYKLYDVFSRADIAFQGDSFINHFRRNGLGIK